MEGKHSFLLSYVDMLFAMLMGVFALFILNLILINPKKDAHKIDPKTELQVTMNWDNHSANDIDLWLRSPEHDIIGYRRKENGYIHLDRDDLGQTNDEVVVDGKKQILYVNQEVLSIRARRPGRYTVNVQYYGTKSDLVTKEVKIPEDVTIQLTDLDPNYKIIYIRTVHLDHPDQEVTAFSFTIEDDGTIDNITTDDDPFVFQSSDNGGTTQFSELQ